MAVFTFNSMPVWCMCTPNLRQPKSETKVVLVLIINQWRVTTNTLCWWVLERSLNSSCSEADPHLCTPSAGRATARKQDRKRASDINSTTSVCSVAQFLLDIFLSDFWLMFQFFLSVFNIMKIEASLESCAHNSTKTIGRLNCIKIPFFTVVVLFPSPFATIHYDESWALACFSLNFYFHFSNFRSIIPQSTSKLKVSHLSLHPLSWVCSF